MYNSALVVKMLQSEGRMRGAHVTETSTELVPSLEPIPEIKDTKSTTKPPLVSTTSGKSNSDKMH